MKIYCMKCRKQTEPINCKDTMIRNRKMTKGNCSLCGTNVCRIGGIA